MPRFSEYMRAHRVTGFPDPTPSPPASFTGYSMVIRRGGAYLAVPQTINPTSPVYKQATSTTASRPAP